MDMQTLLSYNWGAMMPEFIILGTALILSLADLFMKEGSSRRWLGWLGLSGIVGAIVSLALMIGAEDAVILYDTFVLDSFAKAFKFILLLGGALIFLLAIDYEPREGMKERGEFYYLLLAALLGAMMMASSRDLITLFTGLELLSISSYILAGLRKRDLKSNESAMKYVINGGISTAITLFGMSYIYGLTGTTSLSEMIPQLNGLTESGYVYIASISFLLVFVGLSFKIATVPFHMWAPDVYEGAPTPVTAFLSVVSKTAGFVIILRICLSVFGNIPDEGGMQSILQSLQGFIAILAAVTMIVGNTVALRQKNIKRMLAYSSIAHAGYVLVGFVAFGGYFYFDAIWFYLLAYVIMNVGIFAIVGAVSRKTGSEDISAFAGLYRRSPAAGIAVAIFLLSLAGLPGTAGFIGKVTIFMNAFTNSTPQIVLASIMIATTVISYFYYFGILTQVFFRKKETDEPFTWSAPLIIVTAVCVAATILLGIFPGAAFDFLNANIS
ncbi:NADH-quinone oxidoreductase subunit NuoN [Metabacillus indicus]|uniref:NADH-quinone oxidoreductase subunit NuoN n=1 Tax=Metabacillus indicus TaxID=246786 RepID=UPI00049300FD|nr:NADH-quinone oxidoreductase subunit NuoN [Metabacillus indicus]KEZ49437.1 NADH:ubiquinone oxidoreductase subunit N [Metabacillus indicus LMG 22858]